MGKLTTHVLDTTLGKPGSNISVALYRIDGDERQLLNQVVTNDDGRVDGPILEGSEFKVGVYELLFSVGAYFDTHDNGSADQPRFLDDVVLRFGISAKDQHYHVPLLISPYSYSTYRGS